jgi:hypothetical protein
MSQIPDHSEKKKYKWWINTWNKNYSITLAIKEMQVKWHWNSISPQPEWLSLRKQRTYADDDVGEKEPLSSAYGNVN